MNRGLWAIPTRVHVAGLGIGLGAALGAGLAIALLGSPPLAWAQEAGAQEAGAQEAGVREAGAQDAAPTSVADLTAAAEQTRPWVIATGPTTAVEYRIAGVACEVAREATGTLCAVAPLGSGPSALAQVRDGAAEFALVRADTFLAEAAALPEGTEAMVLPVLALHDTVATLIGRADLAGEEGDALLGTRVNIGAPETRTRALWEALEGAVALDPATFPLRTELRAAEAGEALCAGRIDGFLWLLSHPSGATRNLIARCGAKALNVRGPGVDALIADRTDLRRVVIPQELYGTDFEVVTIGTPVLLVANRAAPNGRIARLARALVSNVDVLATRHPALLRLDVDSLVARGLPRPLHPAAAAVYQEMGLTN